MKRLLLILMNLLLIASVFATGRAEPEADPASMSFDETIASSNGSEVTFYMWGGSASINTWIDTYVAGTLLDRYDIRLRRVPMDAAVFVNKLMNEKQAGKERGVIDLLWINGENFRNAKTAGLLYGPFTQLLPNFTLYVDEGMASTDAGFPVDGYEAPYGKAQFNFEYDSEKIEDFPASYTELYEWVKRNPGRFTYPQPPDFTGSAFIRQTFYAATGGYAQYMGGFDSDLFDRQAQKLWDYLNSIKPYLWQEGRSYPRDLATLDTLFERGEVDINMSFTQARAATRIKDGRYPETVRSAVLEEGALFNTHFTAIPFNAPNKPGALVLANLLLDPEVQLSKNDPTNWGDFTVLSFDKLPSDMTDRFLNLNLGEATLPPDTLDRHAVPEIPSEYIEALESGWEEHVLKDQD